MSINPAFDFPLPLEDGQEYFPVEGDNNLGYKWVADDPEQPTGTGVWTLIKQIPNPDVTKDYVDDEIQRLEDKIENITDMVKEVVQVTAALDYKYQVEHSTYEAYINAVNLCLSQNPDNENKLADCRENNQGLYTNNYAPLKGLFSTIEATRVVDNITTGGEFSEVHYLCISQKDMNDNIVKWCEAGNAEGGAVAPGDFIQIIHQTGTGSDPGNYGYYEVVSGRLKDDSIDTENMYVLGLAFQHGKGKLIEGSNYRIRGLVAKDGLTMQEADERYLFQTPPAGYQTVGGKLYGRVETGRDDADNTFTTKKYVDDKMTDSFPIGGVVPFCGLASEVPDDWLLCNGEGFNSTTYPKLKKFFPNNTLPDFRGHFLVGYGADVYGTFLARYEQTTALPKVPFKTNSYTHAHAINDGVYVNKDQKSTGNGAQVNYTSSGYNAGTPTSMATDINNHVHDINQGGDPFNRPNCYAINWIIKGK